MIKEQLHNGIVEVVDETTNFSCERVHYLSHHAVIRQDKQTTKLRVVYDASVKTDGPSLNDWLKILTEHNGSPTLIQGPQGCSDW